MPDTEEAPALMLEMMRQFVGSDIVDMLQNFNDAGPQGVALTNSLMIIPRMLGKYSRMTPYVMQQVKAVQSAQRSTSSIGGKMQTAMLVRKVVQYQQGIYQESIDDKAKKGGFMDFGGSNKNKPQQSSNLLG